MHHPEPETPKQNQQNSPVKIKSGKANQEKNQRRQQTQKQSNASKSKTETKQADNGNPKQQQQKRSEKQQQQSKLELNQDGGDNAEIPRMEKEAKPKPKIPTVVLAGDSILKNIKGWLMSRTKAMKSYSFSGADTDDMKYHLQPIIKRNPHHIVLHCGTNDLAWRTPEEIATNITGPVKEIKGNNIEFLRQLY